MSNPQPSRLGSHVCAPAPWLASVLYYLIISLISQNKLIISKIKYHSKTSEPSFNHFLILLIQYKHWNDQRWYFKGLPAYCSIFVLTLLHHVHHTSKHYLILFYVLLCCFSGSLIHLFLIYLLLNLIYFVIYKRLPFIKYHGRNVLGRD